MEQPPDQNRGEHDRDHDDQHLRAEIIERLPETVEGYASERAVEVMAAMMTACMHANERGGLLEGDNARAIAHFLALGIDDGTALRRFADDEVVDLDDVQAELRALHDRHTLYPETREVTNWLAQFVFAQQVPELRPDRATTDPESWQHAISYKEDLGLTVAVHARGIDAPFEHTQLMDKAEALAMKHGVPGVAMLRLPTVDLARADLEDLFTEHYLGSFDDLDRLFGPVLPLLGPDDTHRPYSQLTPTEQRFLRARLGSECQAITHGGRIHLFRRFTDEP